MKATATLPAFTLDGKPLGKQHIVAWFCPEVAEPYGPAGYCGLPGLIFCVKTPEVTYTITGFDLAEQGLEIEPPTLGQTIGREQFELAKRKVLFKF